ncbi:MAG: sigma-54 dependent transcriptional regulator [Proteobacteria bacterium]|nr:sigma-54 dependent transcriptional regulator [Pseudomonadota bacterium]
MKPKRGNRRAPVRAGHVLVVDDEPDIRELIELTLVKMGLTVTAVGSLSEASVELGRSRFELCLTDMRLSDGEGLELVRQIAAMPGDLPVAVITAHGSTENAVAALKAGAFDYVSKPVGLEQLRTLVRAALALPSAALEHASNERLLGGSPALNEVRELIARLARTQAPVQIAGESGSGKELAARLIHAQGARRERPFVPVNCGAIPDNLMESEFFGYRKGAFTGADQDRPGFFQVADGGTLFLDEVAELPLAMQVKLLRAIQERRVRRLGEALEEPVDVRIISASHQDLAACVATGTFRQDLYYRLNVIELRMPPLRERREDVPELARSILARAAMQSGAAAATLSGDALEELARYDFPGNVRELENILERALALSSGGAIQPEDLRLRPALGEEPPGGAGSASLLRDGASLPDQLDQVERETILRALGETGFNRTAAARLLGITFRQLRYRMQRLGIREPATPD